MLSIFDFFTNVWGYLMNFNLFYFLFLIIPIVQLFLYQIKTFDQTIQIHV